MSFYTGLGPPPFPLDPEFLHNQLVFGERFAANHGGVLPNTLFWNYLKARHDLNPARFDHFHPVVGPLIERSELAMNPVVTNPVPLPIPVVIPPSLPIETPMTAPPVTLPIEMPITTPPIEMPPVINPPVINPPIVTPPAVPEPASVIMLTIGILGIFLVRVVRHRRLIVKNTMD